MEHQIIYSNVSNVNRVRSGIIGLRSTVCERNRMRTFFYGKGVRKNGLQKR